MQMNNSEKALSPDEILAGWRALVATGAHVHLPQIAEHLKVPQAALLAARVGTGATRLQPDLAAVLRPIRDWHRVLLVASSELGVFMPMDHITNLTEDSTGLGLFGDTSSARIDPSLAHEVYIFEDNETGPGTSKSIQAFDGAGQSLLKVILFHKPSFRAALDWTAGFVHPDQSRKWRPATGGDAGGSSAIARNNKVAETGGQGGDMPPHAFAETLEHVRETGQQLEIRARSPGVDVTWRGQLTKLRLVGPMVHLHEATLRAHLNLAKATAGGTKDALTALFVPGQSVPALEIVKGGS
ncbi:hypothetical protein O4H61_01605 [Roseovarius aestuarii]|nr:hypothetical protein [Roseovarius aestuarii]